jgi:hypothetical protein
MNALRVLFALLLAIVLAGGCVVNPTAINAEVTKDVAPAFLPNITPVVGVKRHFKWLLRNHRAGLRKYALHDTDFRALMVLTVVAVLSYGHHPDVMWAAAPAVSLVYRQKWTSYVTGWADSDEQTGDLVGPSIKFVKPGELPEDKLVKKVQWGQWSVREMYELADLDYFIFLCENAKELRSVLRHIRGRGLQAPDGKTWWPCWASFGDKGNHLVFVEEKLYPAGWLARLGFKSVLKGKGDRFWKFMKRYRRLSAHPELFAQMSVISVQENWMGRAGWTMFNLVNPEIGKPFTVLVRPMIEGADGQSFGTVAGVKRAWGKNTRPLDMWSLGGACFIGAIKGHMMIATPNKKLPADFVISDPKDELVLERTDIFYLNIQAHCHRYSFARTDTQSVLHYGFEPFLAVWSKMYLDELRTELLNPEKASRLLGDVEMDEDGPIVEDEAWILQKIAVFYRNTKFQFNRIPHIFRLLVNTKTKGLRDLCASNDRNSVRIPLPKALFTRRYIAVWEDVIDETGLETETSTHMLRKGECFMSFSDGIYAGEVTTWRQPNGYWRFNILNAIGPINFVLIYGEDIYQWMAKSPAIFVPAEDQAEMLENWDGADFDDNVIVGRGPAIINHFKALPPFPDQKPDVDDAKTVIPANFSWNWQDLMPYIDQAKAMKGIGFYCNRWMVGNYHLRLALTNPSYRYLLDNISAPFWLLGRGSEHIVDSHVKLGGTGLEWADAIVKDFETQLRHLSEFFVWTTKGGELKSRMGAKVANRIFMNGGKVRLPIDDAVDAVRVHVAEFEAWADATYCTLPNSWGLDPVLFAMDTYVPANQKLYQSAFDIHNLWSSLMMPTRNIRDDEQRKLAFKTAHEKMQAHFRNATYKGTVGVVAILWQSIYHPDNLKTKETPGGYSRYTCEDLLWNPGVVDETLTALEGITKFSVPAFPLQHQFVVTFDISKKLADQKITTTQVGQWATMGVKQFPAILRPGDGKVNVYLPVKLTATTNKDVLVGHINDRNAMRCILLNRGQEVRARFASRLLKDGSPSTNALLANVSLKELRPMLQLNAAPRRPERAGWETVDSKILGGIHATA